MSAAAESAPGVTDSEIKVEDNPNDFKAKARDGKSALVAKTDNENCAARPSLFFGDQRCR